METILIDGLSFALPLFVIATGGIYSEKSGIINLALEGLQGVGAFVGALSVILLADLLGYSQGSMFYIAMIASIAGGMLYSMLHAALCIKFRANQIISGIVINILAVALTTFLTSVVNHLIVGEASNKFQLGVSSRFTVPMLSEIPFLGGLFKNMYPFEIVILVIAVLAWYILYKTRFGMRLQACGDNPHAVDATGGNVEKIRFIAVLISGALSGLGGICFAYSLMANFSPSIYMGYGYLAIASMIFGNWKISTTFAACLFFGFAKSAGYQLCLNMNLSSNFSDLFLILPYALTLILLMFFSKHNCPPKALGEIFDKESR